METASALPLILVAYDANFNLLGVYPSCGEHCGCGPREHQGDQSKLDGQSQRVRIEHGENLTGGPLTGRTSADRLNCAPSRLQNWTRSAGPAGSADHRGVLECTRVVPSSLEGPEVECGNPLFFAVRCDRSGVILDRYRLFASLTLRAR